MARDCDGCLLQAKVVSLARKPSPEVAEVMGIKEALSWVKAQGMQNVVLESDCFVGIQAIRSSIHLSSYFGRLVIDCRMLLSDLKSSNVSLQFVKHSANSVADFLAQATGETAERVWNGSDTPSSLAYVSGKDLIQ